MNKPLYKKTAQTTLCTALVALGMTMTMTAMTAHAKTYNSIPKVMQGTWSMASATYCKRNDTSKLTVTAKQLQFWESRAKVSSVSKKGNAITVSVKMTGEGETWYEKRRFVLKNNNRKLVNIIDADTEVVRYRCIAR